MSKTYTNSTHPDFNAASEWARFLQTVGDTPVSYTVWYHWEQADPWALANAARAIDECGANVWVFSADDHHFEEFAEEAEILALQNMTPAQKQALLYWYED